MGREEAREAICSQRRPRLALSWPPCPTCLGPEEGAVWGLGGSWQRGRGTVQSVSHSRFRGSTLHRAPPIPKRQSRILAKEGLGPNMFSCWITIFLIMVKYMQDKQPF